MPDATVIQGTYCLHCGACGPGWHDVCPACGYRGVVHVMAARCDECGKTYETIDEAEKCCQEEAQSDATDEG